MFIDNTDVIRGRQAIERNKVHMLLLASISHEYRTPLNAILANTNLIKQQMKARADDSLDRPLHIVSSSVDLLLSLVDDILDSAKMERGAFRLNESEFQLTPLMDEVRGIFEIQALGKGLEFDVSYEMMDSDLEGESAVIKQDRKRLKQVLINLISNSLKFTIEGHIRVKGMISDEYATFRVEDTGLGISENDKKRLFETFGMGIDSSRINENGSGLGLGICKKLVESMGGRIRLDSQQGVGTQVEFMVALQGFHLEHFDSMPSCEDMTIPAYIPPLETFSFHREQRERVMIVDDNFFNIEVLKQLLISHYADLDISTSLSGMVALDLIDA